MLRDTTPMDKQTRVDPHGACRYLTEQHGIKRRPPTLAKYRSLGGGPLYRKVNGKILYDLVHLDEYAKTILGEPFSSTSDYGQRA